MPPRSPAAHAADPSFIELFTPKLITVFREGYGWRDLPGYLAANARAEGSSES